MFSSSFEVKNRKRAGTAKKNLTPHKKFSSFTSIGQVEESLHGNREFMKISLIFEVKNRNVLAQQRRI
jgi:hypothetical protein